MDTNEIEYFFSKMDAFKTLRFEYIKAVDSIGNSTEDLKKEYDNFSAELTELFSNSLKISTNNLPLTIGIVGDYNVGKSSVINSLIGSEYLSVADMPNTSRITILLHKDIPVPQIYRIKMNGRAEESTYYEYMKYGTHQADSIEKQSVADETSHFEIYHPSAVLKSFQIVDTPGFSSKSEEDDRITKEYLDKVDILLWVFNANIGTISENELHLLKGIDNKQIIAVINRIDDLPPSSRKAVIQSFKSVFNFFKLTPYSAVNALDFQKDTFHNAGVYNEVAKEIMKLLPLSESLRVNNKGNKMSISNAETEIFENHLKVIEEDSEYVEYHFSLLEILKEIRSEVADRKLMQFEERIRSFLSKEEAYWQEKIEEFEAGIKNNESSFKDFEESLQALKTEIFENFEDYRFAATDELPTILYHKLFYIGYQDGGWFESDKKFLRRYNLSDNDFSEILAIIKSAFKDFYSELTGYLLEGLKEYEIDYESSDEIEIIRLLSEQLAENTYYAVIGMFNNCTDFEINPNADIEKILTNNIYLCISDKGFCRLALIIINKIVFDITAPREAEYLRVNAIVEKLIKETNNILNE